MSPSPLHPYPSPSIPIHPHPSPRAKGKWEELYRLKGLAELRFEK